MRVTLAGALFLAAVPADASEPILEPPLDCNPEAACFIQQYVDADPGPDASDFMCGPLANDGHKGTDFALSSLAALEAGVPVTASGPGTVESVRDGMPDIPANDPDAPPLDGRDCGNGVVISHGDGWETQYCHLKQGTVAVEQGQRVGVTTTLGEVGLSGNSTYPHVHLSVRKDGEVVDPFDPEGRTGCDESPKRTLWMSPIAYAPGGLIDVGMTDRVPDYATVKAGTAGETEMPAQADALVVWGYVFGGRSGDVLSLAIEGPEGSLLTEEVTLEKSQPQLYRAVGRRTPDGGWVPGSYRGTIVMRRDGAEIDRRETTVTLTP